MAAEKPKVYPGLTLERGIERIKALKSNLGQGPFSREHVAKGLGYQGVTGTSGRAVASLVYFGLLEKKKNVYDFTELAQKVFHPVTDDEYKSAIAEAVHKPGLYEVLITDYMNKPLPAMFESVLVRQYGITDAAAAEVGNTFKASLIYAGMYRGGVVREFEQTITSRPDPADTTDSTNSPLADPTDASRAPQSQAPVTPPAPVTAQPTDMLTFDLESGILISFPRSMQQDLLLGKFSDIIQKLNNPAGSGGQKPPENASGVGSDGAVDGD